MRYPVRMECSPTAVFMQWVEGDTFTLTKAEFQAKVTELGSVAAARAYYIDLFCDLMQIPEEDRTAKFLLELRADNSLQITWSK